MPMCQCANACPELVEGCLRASDVIDDFFGEPWCLGVLVAEKVTKDGPEAYAIWKLLN